MRRTAWEIVNDLQNKGELDTLINSGFCYPQIINNLEISRRVDVKLSYGQNVSKAVLETSCEFRMCTRSIFKVLKVMKEAGKP